MDHATYIRSKEYLQMNQKKARKLRRRAYNRTKGLVNTAYVENAATGAKELIPECTRAVYQKLKKEYLEKIRRK
jgi:hypothetical protein